MWIERDISRRIAGLAASRPATVVTGARQVGKTALLRTLFPEHTFVSLDLPADAQMAEEDPDTFLRQYPTPVIVDEVQYAPGLFRHLKRAIDEQRSANGHFILTGWQKFTLMQAVTDSLAGRAGIVELDPLSLHELERANLHSSLESLIVRGSYPELHASPAIDTRGFYRSYTASYLERDVRNLLNVAQLRDFERFLRACALRSGQLLNKSELGRDVGISASTSNEWLSVLEASNIITLLEPWFANGTKSVVKTPKLYFLDTGLLCFLVNIRDERDLLRSPQLGAIWETFVHLELRKHLELSGEADALFFWRDRQREIDFLLHRGGRFELFEAKWSETPSARDAAHMLSIGSVLGEENIESRSIVCRTPRAHRIEDRVRAVPLSKVVSSG